MRYGKCHYLPRKLLMKFCLIYLPLNSINAALVGPMQSVFVDYN